MKEAHPIGRHVPVVFNQVNLGGGAGAEVAMAQPVQRSIEAGEVLERVAEARCSHMGGVDAIALVEGVAKAGGSDGAAQPVAQMIQLWTICKTLHHDGPG